MGYRLTRAAIIVNTAIALAYIAPGCADDYGAKAAPVTSGAPTTPYQLDGGKWMPQEHVSRKGGSQPREVTTSLGHLRAYESDAVVRGVRCGDLAQWMAEGHGLSALVGMLPPGDFKDWGYVCAE